MKLLNILYIIIGILSITIVSATSVWVNDPNSCPTSYQSQTCSGSDLVCGFDGAITFCSAPPFGGPPTTNTTSTTDQTTSYDGGYLVDCIANDGTAPRCDNSGNFWCDRNSTLQNSPIYRKTVCVENTWGQTAPGICISGRYNCYGDTNCESTSSSTCGGISPNTHYNTGTCETDPYTSGSGTCVANTNYFACDGSITDTDGAEWHATASCGSATGTYQLNECVSSTEANCTRISDYLDCDNGDGDNNQLTCNQGSPNNGCEINPGTTANNSHSIYQSCSTFACQSGWLDCNPNGLPSGDGTNTDGCETQEGATCGISGHGTFATNQCYSTTGNCTASNTINTWLDCDNDDSDSNVLTCNGGTNGCEVQNNTACTVGSVSGTINMCSGGVGNCVVDNQDIGTTGIEVAWSGINPMLWLTQYGSGLIMNLTGANGNSFTVDTDSNVNTIGNITADTGFFSLAWSFLTNVPDLIYGIWTGNNDDGILISNGTALGINQTALNNSVIDIGVNSGFNSTYNSTYSNILNQQCPVGTIVNGTLSNGTFTCITDSGGISNNDNATLDSLNITKGINLNNNATISRSDVGTRIFIDERGNIDITLSG